jgi:DNA-binding transcriptional ArsR family regulator
MSAGRSIIRHVVRQAIESVMCNVTFSDSSNQNMALAVLERGQDFRPVLSYNHMVVRRQSSADYLDRLFGALADATRRDILARVMDSDASVSELAARYRMSFAAVQKHVAVLERAHLVTKRKDGRAQRVAGNPGAVRRANRLLQQFEQIWQARIDRLDALLSTSNQGE